MRNLFEKLIAESKDETQKLLEEFQGTKEALMTVEGQVDKEFITKAAAFYSVIKTLDRVKPEYGKLIRDISDYNMCRLINEIQREILKRDVRKP